MLRTSAARPGRAKRYTTQFPAFCRGTTPARLNYLLSLASGNDRDSELSHLREDPGEVPAFVDFIEARYYGMLDELTVLTTDGLDCLEDRCLWVGERSIDHLL